MALTLAELAALDKFQKLLVAEVECKRALEAETWTLESGVTWYIDLDIDEDVFRATLIEIDASVGIVDLTEYFSVSDVNSNADSFYYNPWTKRLYMHTTDSDSPAALVSSDPKYSIVIHFNVYFSNRPKSIEPAIQKLLNPGLEWWAASDDLYDWTEVEVGTSTVARESTTVYGDKSAYAVKITIDGSGNDANIYQSIKVRPGSKVKVVTRYAINGAGSSQAFLRIRDSGANVYLTSAGAWQAGSAAYETLDGTSGAYVETSITFVAHASYSEYLIIFTGDAASAVVFFDSLETWSYRLSRPCRPLIPPDGLPNVTQSVGDYYRPDEQVQIGVLRLIDAHYFTDKLGVYIWNNSKVRLWLAELADVFEDFTPFGAGIANIPRHIAGFVEFEIGDPRIELKPLPLDEYRFNSTDYPNCKSDWVNKPVPIALGYFYEIKPPCSDTSAYKYKVSQTSFFGASIPINAITEVRKCSDGSLLTLTTHYTVDLANGIIDCIADYEPDGIYCNGYGLEVDFDSAGAVGYFVQDLIYFYYVTANKFLRDDLNLKSLKDLTDNRAIPMSYPVKEETDYQTILSDWKVTNIFQTYYGLDGQFYFPFYDEEVPDEAPHFIDEDFNERPVMYDDTDQCFKSVTVKADWREYSERYDNIVTETSEQAEARHSVKKQLELIAYTYFGTAANELAANYLSMHKNPPVFLEVPVKKNSALMLNPTDKFYATWREKDKSGTYHYKLNKVAFRVLSIERDINAGIARLIALKDVSDFWNIFT